MNWLDIVILILIVIPTLIGLKMGIIKAVLSLAGVIVGVILAGRYYDDLAGKMTFITHDGLASVVAFVIILVGVMIIAAVVASLLKKATSVVLLGWVNRLGGAILGLFLGALFCGALLTVWANYFGEVSSIVESGLAKLLLDIFPVVLTLLPSEFDSVRSFFQ